MECIQDLGVETENNSSLEEVLTEVGEKVTTNNLTWIICCIIIVLLYRLSL